MRAAANLSFLFQELPVEARFRAARDCGFRGVEVLFPYGESVQALADAAAAAEVEVVLINTGLGDTKAGEAGFAALPERRIHFRDSFQEALRYARGLSCLRIHVLSGKWTGTEADAGGSLDTLVANLQWAANEAARDGISILLEPLNRYDVPCYALPTPEVAAEVIGRVGRPNVGLQFDLYHWQIMGGDLTRRIQAFGHLIRHAQISCVPGRGEPDLGEVNLEFVLRTLASVGYDGWVSGEYRPRGSTADSLRWVSLVESLAPRCG
jgi:2-dehydrotetronate isomerase